jgi:HK97 family phage major capsid protein
MNINETDNTLTATREEFNTIIDKALDRKIKSMPDRTALSSIEKGKTISSNTPNINMGINPTINPNLNHANAVAPAADREKILKTFKFFNAVATNDHGTLRSIMQTYEPEYVRTLSPQVEGTSSAGGYLVPPEFYADVLFLLNQYGFARKYCAQIQMNSNVLNVSTLTGTPTVSWVSENGIILASKGTFGRLILTAQKLAAIYPISNELLADANVDVYNTILRIFVEVFGQQEDIQVFNGTGSPFTGILQTSGVVSNYLGGASNSGKTHFPDITLDDLITLVQSVGPAQQRGACLFVEQNTLTDLLKKKDSQSRYLWDLATSNDPNINGANGFNATNLQFHGYPVVSLPNGVMINSYNTSTNPSVPFVLFGNLQTAGCWLGTRGGMELRVSYDATADTVNAFTNDLQLLRMTERIAFGVGQPGYLGVLSTSAT